MAVLFNPAFTRPLFLIVSRDREGEDEHDDHDGEEGCCDEGDHKSCNESTASLQIVLEDIRHLVTVTLSITLTLVQDAAHTPTAQPEIILQSMDKLTGHRSQVRSNSI